MSFLWMFIVFVLLPGIWRVLELFSAFDKHQRYYQLKCYQWQLQVFLLLQRCYSL